MTDTELLEQAQSKATTDFEREFIANKSEALTRYGKFTDKQRRILQDIANKPTNEVARALCESTHVINPNGGGSHES